MNLRPLADVEASRIVLDPWTRRDVDDMLAIRENLDWLLGVIKSGCTLNQDVHGWAIRAVLEQGMALERKERAFRAKSSFNPNQPRVPAGNDDGGQWTDTGGGASGGALPVRKPKRPTGGMPLPRRKPGGRDKPSPYADSPYYDPVTGIYDPPINPTLSPFDFIGLPARPVAGAVGGILKPAATEAVREARHVYNLAKLRYIKRDVSKLMKVGKGSEGLTKPQMQNLKRMRKRNPDMKGTIEVTRYSDGSAVARFDKPARDIPNSYATYEKHIAANGVSKYVAKITRAPDGKIVHIHPKSSR